MTTKSLNRALLRGLWALSSRTILSSVPNERRRQRAKFAPPSVSSCSLHLWVLTSMVPSNPFSADSADTCEPRSTLAPYSNKLLRVRIQAMNDWSFKDPRQTTDPTRRFVVYFTFEPYHRTTVITATPTGRRRSLLRRDVTPPWHSLFIKWGACGSKANTQGRVSLRQGHQLFPGSGHRHKSGTV